MQMLDGGKIGSILGMRQNHKKKKRFFVSLVAGGQGRRL
jgi:uncharacterized membrane protein YsdA (DUF1294 family)